MTEVIKPERPKPIDTGANQADIAIANAEAAAKREARKATPAATPAPPAPSPAPAPAPAVSSGNDGGSTAGDLGEQQPSAESDDVPAGVKKKLDKLTKRVYDREERIKALQAELDQARKGANTTSEHASPGPAPAPAPASDAKPTRAQFNGDDEKYLEALSDWKVDQRLKQEAEKAEKARRDQALKSRWDTFKEREAAFAAQHDDFHETAYESPVNYSQAMVDFITDSEKGPEIAYHLGKHLDEAKAIAALPPMRQAIALDRLEQSLKPTATQASDDDDDDIAAAPTPSPARKVTQAPTPPVTVSPAASAKKSPNDPNAQMTAEERIRMWRQQRRSRRR